MWEVPVGFVRTSDDRIEKSADRQVQHAVAGVFQKFRELGSARQTMLWYREAQLPLPEVRPGTLGQDILWRLPSEHRIHQMLRNPCYAGALVYGRTAAKTVIVDGRARQSHRQKQPVAQWRIVLLDNHAGYMSSEDFCTPNSCWRPIATDRRAMLGAPPNGGRRCLVACYAVDAADGSSMWPIAAPQAGCHGISTMGGASIVAPPRV